MGCGKRNGVLAFLTPRLGEHGLPAARLVSPWSTRLCVSAVCPVVSSTAFLLAQIVACRCDLFAAPRSCLDAGTVAGLELLFSRVQGCARGVCSGACGRDYP